MENEKQKKIQVVLTPETVTHSPPRLPAAAIGAASSESRYGLSPTGTLGRISNGGARLADLDELDDHVVQVTVTPGRAAHDKFCPTNNTLHFANREVQRPRTSPRGAAEAAGGPCEPFIDTPWRPRGCS